jgi:hypothetical protein
VLCGEAKRRVERGATASLVAVLDQLAGPEDLGLVYVVIEWRDDDAIGRTSRR